MATCSRAEQLARAADRLRHAVLGGDGATSVAVRRDAHDATGTDPVLSSYVDAVRNHAYRITDGDLAVLHDAGLSDDAIFDITVAAALGAAQRSLTTGLAALDDEPSP